MHDLRTDRDVINDQCTGDVRFALRSKPEQRSLTDINQVRIISLPSDIINGSPDQRILLQFITGPHGYLDLLRQYEDDLFFGITTDFGCFNITARECFCCFRKFRFFRQFDLFCF